MQKKALPFNLGRVPIEENQPVSANIVPPKRSRPVPHARRSSLRQTLSLELVLDNAVFYYAI